MVITLFAGGLSVQAAPPPVPLLQQDSDTVKFSGDSVVSPSREQRKWKIFGLKLPVYTPPKRMDRGIVEHLFIPRKTWQLGLSVSHYQESTDNYDFLVIEEWDGKAYTFKVSPFFCWYFKNNWSVGGRFTFKDTRFDIERLKISLEDDMSFELNGIDLRNRTYQCAAFVRNYVGLHPRIGLFNETHLTYGYGKGTLSSGNLETSGDTDQTAHEVQLGIRPGICGFVTNSVMFEFSFEIGGLRYRRISQLTDGQVKSSRSTGSANFKLNILSLNLGLAVCI